MADPTPSTFGRRFFISTNVLLQCLAVLALMIMINWLVSRHYTRYDWTQSGYYKLSEKTKQVLKTLKEPLTVIVYLQPNAADETSERLFDDVRNLLKEFKYFGKAKLAIEYVDPYRDLKRAKQIVEEYKIDAPREPALVIFVSGPRHKYVGKEDMVTMEQRSLRRRAAAHHVVQGRRRVSLGDPDRHRRSAGDGVFSHRPWRTRSRKFRST